MLSVHVIVGGSKGGDFGGRRFRTGQDTSRKMGAHTHRWFGGPVGGLKHCDKMCSGPFHGLKSPWASSKPACGGVSSG